MKISHSNTPVLSIRRKAIQREKIVYVLTANRRYKYSRGWSKIVYIGMTSKGVNRVASSAASKARKVLKRSGFNEVQMHILWSSPVQNVKTWVLLERALLAEFASYYGEVPEYNKQGKHYKWNDKLDGFSQRRVREILQKLSD